MLNPPIVSEPLSLDDLLSDAARELRGQGMQALAESVEVARARLAGQADPEILNLRILAPTLASYAKTSDLEIVTKAGVAAIHWSETFARDEMVARTYADTLLGISERPDCPRGSRLDAIGTAVPELARTLLGMVVSSDVVAIGQFEALPGTQPTALGMVRALPDPAAAYVGHLDALHQAARAASALLGERP